MSSHKNFGEDVCYLSWRCTEEYMNGTIMQKLSDVVHMDLNVLGLLSLNWIIADSNGAPTIIVNNKFSKYPLQPQALSCCIYNSSILYFCIWECYGTLLLAWPVDWSFYKHEHISWCRLSICVVTCPVTVSKPNQIKIRFCFVEDPMSSCSLNKVKNPFGSSLVDLMRLIHVYWSHTKFII